MRNKLRCVKHTLNLLNQSFRSSAFFLLNARSINGRSSSRSLANGIICAPIWLKYSLASSFVLVPSPCVTRFRFKPEGRCGWKSTHLVVFRDPFPVPIELLVPLEILRDSEEVFLLVSFPYLRSGCRLPSSTSLRAVAYPNDRRNELNQKVWQP